MMVSWRLLVSLIVLAAAAPVAALPEPDEEQLANNRRLFEKWRADPEHYARLKRDWRAFRSLPSEKQARIRRLDYDLHQEPPETQARLWRALERYAAWLERLPPDDLRRVQAADDPDERLRVIQEIREREWLARLPRAVRERIQNVPPAQRAAEIRKEREREQKRRQEWQRALRRPLPIRLTDFPPEVQAFVKDSLYPLLSDEEKQRLKNAEGRWLYGATLAELADRHPIVLPPSPTIGPVRYQDLPPQIQRRFLKVLDRARLRDVEGKWPDFALYIAEVARSRNLPLPPLGPCRPREFTPAVQQFLDRELLPKLDEKEKQRLKAAEGRWPDYPQLLLELARTHGLKVPGMALPGPREFWDNLRGELPVGPDLAPRDFAQDRSGRQSLTSE